jgi:potassium-transporting ATPase KdpC subunit
MRRDLQTSLIAVVLITLVFGLAYPLAFTGVAQLLFPGNANGSKLTVNGKVIGSRLIGQSFQKPVIGANGKPKVDSDGNPVTIPDRRYFQPRPSQSSYSADATFFSNLGPNSIDERDEVKANLTAYLTLERPYTPGLDRAAVPVDAITQSASGVDPDISEANADIQAHRIASVRRIPLSQVEDLIDKYTDGRFLGVFGEPGVNVLKLNLALDREAPTR